MELDRVADELYSLPLADFVATRNARAQQAKEDGAAELARQIGKLAKPNSAAWLANQLVRAHRAEVEPLLELGAGLRAATASLSGEQLRALGQQQRQLVSALTALARRLSGPDGPRISPDTERALQDTLHAALADSEAAEQLLAGHLSQPLTRSGFESGFEAGFEAGFEVGGSEPTAQPRSAPPKSVPPKSVPPKSVPSKSVPPKSSPPKASPAKASPAKPVHSDADQLSQRREQRRRQSQQREDAARRRAEGAGAVRDQAAEELDAAREAQLEATAAVRRLRTELEQAVASQGAAEQSERRARAELDKAERAHKAAVRALEQAAEQRGSLGGVGCT
ncbi:MAG: hypothetical protein JWO63_3192 [Frankiales bacterium]|nr:hypothetical protein [Frankiales bacterium]